MEHIRTLKAYEWPGNVRELENVLRRAIILSQGDVLELDECWFQRSDAIPAPACALEEGELKSLISMEKEHILKILRHTGGNYGEACNILGITRPTLRKKINDYGLRQYFEAPLKD